MDHVELVLLFLLVAVAALTWLARALDVPYPILLVVGGSVIGFVPGVPSVELNPDLVLLLVLGVTESTLAGAIDRRRSPESHGSRQRARSRRARALPRKANARERKNPLAGFKPSSGANAGVDPRRARRGQSYRLAEGDARAHHRLPRLAGGRRAGGG